LYIFTASAVGHSVAFIVPSLVALLILEGVFVLLLLPTARLLGRFATADGEPACLAAHHYLIAERA